MLARGREGGGEEGKGREREGEGGRGREREGEREGGRREGQNSKRSLALYRLGKLSWLSRIQEIEAMQCTKKTPNSKLRGRHVYVKIILCTFVHVSTSSCADLPPPNREYIVT